MYHKIVIEARDLLFFRDGRPVNNGAGANWPMPQTAFSALNSAFRQRWPQPQPWEQVSRFDQGSWRRSNRFPSLNTIGPFPEKDGRIFVPTPADLKPGAILAPLINVPGRSNLPSSVKYPVGANIGASKNACAKWMPLDEYRKYLIGDCDVKTVDDEALFDIEERPGISIDAESRTAVDGKLFFGSYMRLRRGVGMAMWAQCQSGDADVVAEFFAGSPRQLVFGGQRGCVEAVLERNDGVKMPFEELAAKASITGRLVKWVLLSPAGYQRGYLPNFVSESGQVMLTVPNGPLPDRRRFRSRDDYRKACRAASRPLSARLVAAVIPKHLSYSGWNLEFNRPERTLNLVPPGSVYYFESANDDDGRILAEVLGRTRSSEFFGSQGFGLGICTSFNYIDFNTLDK